MNEQKNHFEDPKLMAYALGEIEATERAAVEAMLQTDVAAKAAVEEIRATAARLEQALAAEPVAMLDAAGASVRYGKKPRSKLLRFPQVYFVIGGLAAACFAVFVALHEPATNAKGPVEFHEITLTSSPTSGAPPHPAQRPLEASEDLSLLGQAKRRLEDDQRKRLNLVADKQKSIAPAAAPSAKPLELPVASSRGYVGGAMGVKAEHARVALKNLPRSGELAANGSVAFAMLAQSPQATALRSEVADAENYRFQRENDFVSPREEPLSTFSADVDTASYANVRRFIQNGERPPIDAVRTEELVNYFPYRYAPPSGSVPFAASIEAAEAPWDPTRRLVRIGLKGREVSTAQRGAANLVFLLDVSGSMDSPNKLPLVKESMRLLLQRLRPDDHVAIVTYASGSGLALPSTPAAKSKEIAEAIERLVAGGSTNGGMGIQLAYDVAKANFVTGGINRVILCTDGDFNVGVTSEGELVRLIQEKAKSGVFLSALGFGMGNLKDATLQQLADRGNGNYGYIDTRREAEKLLVEQASGTLVTIAKDVKLQVEFNPAKVSRYRLIGYEKRRLNREDFNDDTVDAGEIGAGHTVTALYEIVPASAGKSPGGAEAEPLRYSATGSGSEALEARAEVANELLTLKVRYKEPDGAVSRKLEFPFVDGGEKFTNASDDFKFAAAVASFGMLLRDSPHRGEANYANVLAWAEAGLGSDPGGYRAEFVGLVRQAEALQ